MAKDPAFLFYPGDFSTGTQFFTDEQVGKYVRLLMAQHQVGHLKEEHMIMICKTYDNDIFSKFIKDSDGLYYNQRLEDETVKRKKYSESRSNNRKSEKNISSTYDSHMENINSTINNNKGTEQNLIDFYFKDFPNSSLMESVSKQLNIPKENLIKRLPEFRKAAALSYPNIIKFAEHFKNWVKKQPTEVNNRPKKAGA